LAVSLLRWDAGRRHWLVPRWLPVVSLALVFLCFAVHYSLVLALDKQIDQSAKTFDLLVANEFQAYSFVLVPVLFLTASAFAEWGEVAAGQINTLLRRLRSPWLLVSVTALTAVAILIYQLIRRGSFAPFDVPSAADLVSLLLYGIITWLLFLGVALLGGIAR